MACDKQGKSLAARLSQDSEHHAGTGFRSRNRSYRPAATWLAGQLLAPGVTNLRLVYPALIFSLSVPGTAARGHSSSYPALEVRAALLLALRFTFD
jgi:hypothetical protein